MSGMRHPTISAWQRHEDGNYTAELHGWTLHVKWHPEPVAGSGRRRGFSWSAEQGSKKLVSDEVCEEIEVAMGHAEAQVAPEPTEAPAETTPAHDAHEAGGHH
jgi:hypothetical protein